MTAWCRAEWCHRIDLHPEHDPPRARHGPGRPPRLKNGEGKPRGDWRTAEWRWRNEPVERVPCPRCGGSGWTVLWVETCSCCLGLGTFHPQRVPRAVLSATATQ